MQADISVQCSWGQYNQQTIKSYVLNFVLHYCEIVMYNSKVKAGHCIGRPDAVELCRTKRRWFRWTAAKMKWPAAQQGRPRFNLRPRNSNRECSRWFTYYMHNFNFWAKSWSLRCVKATSQKKTRTGCNPKQVVSRNFEHVLFSRSKLSCLACIGWLEVRRAGRAPLHCVLVWFNTERPRPTGSVFVCM